MDLQFNLSWVVCQACGLSYGDHGISPPTVCGNCGSRDIKVELVMENASISDVLNYKRQEE